MEQKNKELNPVKTQDQDISEIKVRKHRFSMVRAALVALLGFTFLCGLVYPLAVTLTAQVAFPYQANGSQITITLKDGSQKVIGSTLIGQEYESPEYLFGRINSGMPSNLSPESQEYKEELIKRRKERQDKLATVGYTEVGAIPEELLTISGSGLDPHISPDTAYFQLDAVVAGRNAKGWKLITNEESGDVIAPILPEKDYVPEKGQKLTEFTTTYVKDTIDEYTEGRFLWIFGQPRVNVLLVNLSMDGLI